MAKYIDREALIEWLKRIPLKDLSDGLGLCRVIMEDDFKKAIKNMPKGIIVDAVEVVRCKDCTYTVLSDRMETAQYLRNFIAQRVKRKRGARGVE